MNDSSAIHKESAAQVARWLILIHQVPPKPDYLRVKVQRRLERIGAMPLRNSVYVLPRSAGAVEDFHAFHAEASPP